MNEKDIFLNSCKNGYLKNAKHFLANFPSFNLFDNKKIAFQLACYNGHVHVAQWLYNMPGNPTIVISDYENLFISTCCSGYLLLAKWLVSIKPDIDISADNEWAFRLACSRGHLHVAQYLLSIKPDIDISAEGEAAFTDACSSGHLHVAQYLLSIKPNIDVCCLNNYAFKQSCINGYLHVAQWLLSIKPDINISAYFTDIFISACFYKKFNILEWLLSLKIFPPVNMFDCINKTYCYSSFSHNTKKIIVPWLQSLMPFHFIIKPGNILTGNFNDSINNSIKPIQKSNTLALIWVFKKIGYMSYINANLLCEFVIL